MFVTYTQRRRLARKFAVVFTLVLLSSIFLITPVEAEVKIPRVLILNSYSEVYDWTEKLNESIISTFEEEGERVEIFVDSMDSKRFVYPGYMGRLADIFTQKYRDRSFDLIIATDDNALTFLALYRDQVFQDVPVVFLGVNDRSFVRTGAFPHMTGLIENIDIRGTIELALSLHPSTRKVILISDFTRTGINHIKKFRQILPTLPPDLEVVDMLGLGRDELEMRLRLLGEDSIILFFSFFRDLDGNSYYPGRVQQILESAGSVPIYSFWDFMVSPEGGVILGGKTISATSYAKDAARMAISILNGKSISEIPVVWDGPVTVPSFNSKVLASHGLRVEDLPEGSRLFNVPATFCHKYRKLIIANLGFLLFLVGLIIYLGINIYFRKKAEKALFREKKYWESLFEYSPEAMVFSDSRGIIRKCNNKFTQIFGYEGDDVEGKSLDSLFSRSRDQFREATSLSKEMSCGNKVEVETVRMTMDGRNIPVSMMGLPLAIDGRHLADFVIYRDITEQKRSDEELAHRLRFEETLSRVSSRLVFVKHIDRVVFEVLEEIRSFLNCSYIALARMDRPSGCLRIKHEACEEGVAPLLLKKIPLGDVSAILRDLRTMGEVLIQDLFHGATDPFIASITNKRDVRSLLILPLNVNRDLEGMVIFENLWTERRWNDYDISLLQTFCDILGEAFRRVDSSRQLRSTMLDLKKAFDGTFGTMTKILEIKDPYTAGHQQKVTQLAKAIALELDLPQEKVDAVYYSSLVHDIGKINIPSEILSKPGRLTDIEFSLIKNHASYGWEILHNIYFPWPISEIVLQHHERLDGSGYPNGLKGDEILLEARILIVADVVEAMASDRPYRPSLGIDAALEEIEKFSGIRYMPEAVNACITLFRKKGFHFQETEE